MVLSNEFGTVGLTVHWHWQGVNPFQGVLVLCHDYLRHTPALHLFHIHLGPRHVHSVFKGGAQRSTLIYSDLQTFPRIQTLPAYCQQACGLENNNKNNNNYLSKLSIPLMTKSTSKSTQTDPQESIKWPKPGTQCMWLFFHLSVKLHKNYKTRFD